MAKEIEWTRSSILDRLEIYRYWIENNKSETYSKKLETLFNQASRLIAEFPKIGTETDFPDLRVKIIRSYKLFYLDQPDKIQIVRVWDTRQNPGNLKFSKDQLLQ